jgi:hydroxymethylpyrimidine pyrophosphatase-like HAD family hydrolase
MKIKKPQRSQNQTIMKPSKAQKAARKAFIAERKAAIMTKKMADVIKKSNAPNEYEVCQGMVAEYLKIKSRNHLLLLDIDGTLISYRDSFLSRNTHPRAYIKTFLKLVRPYYDIVLYTAGDYNHANSVRAEHLDKFCSLFFWNNHVFHRKKRVGIFKKEADIVRLVDDNNVVHSSEQKYLIQIPTFQIKNKNDKQLIDIGKELVRLAEEFEENRTTEAKFPIKLNPRRHVVRSTGKESPPKRIRRQEMKKKINKIK